MLRPPRGGAVTHEHMLLSEPIVTPSAWWPAAVCGCACGLCGQEHSYNYKKTKGFDFERKSADVRCTRAQRKYGRRDTY